MTLEQKAKAYDEAIERAKEMCAMPTDKATMEYVFPELKVSEDERIREELIDAIHGLWDNDALPMPLSVKRKDGWLAWLEKQGKQEWTDEDEENFQHTLLAIQKSTWYTDSDKKELKEFVASLKQRLTDDTQGNRIRITLS